MTFEYGSRLIVSLATCVGLSLGMANLSLAQTPQRAAAAKAEKAAAAKAEKTAKTDKADKTSGRSHKLSIQVNENKPETMNLALNNATNVLEHYKLVGEKVTVEIVTFGPGLHMLRDDTSPVKTRIAEISLTQPDLTFIACANTQTNMSKREEKPITLVSEAKVVPSGVVRLMELQRKGYAYIRP